MDNADGRAVFPVPEGTAAGVTGVRRDALRPRAVGRSTRRPSHGVAPPTKTRKLPRLPSAASVQAAVSPSPTGSLAMSLIISVLITFLVIILILYLVNMLPIDGRAKQIVRVVVIVLGVISMLKYLAVF
jgi:hypothetical protein